MLRLMVWMGSVPYGLLELFRILLGREADPRYFSYKLGATILVVMVEWLWIRCTCAYLRYGLRQMMVRSGMPICIPCGAEAPGGVPIPDGGVVSCGLLNPTPKNDPFVRQ